MDLRQIEQAVKDSKGGIREKKEVVAATLVSPDEATVKSSIDSGRALQLFLDHVSISSIPDFIINNPYPELAVKTTDTVGYAIQLLYDKNICVAPIVDELDFKLEQRKCSEEPIGLIGLASMILWFLQEDDRSRAHRQEDNGGTEIKDEDFFSFLERNPPIAQTKTAVICALLESSGLKWFDNIADKALSEFWFENEHAVQIYGDQNMVEAIQVLWESKLGTIAVVERDTERLIGSVRCSDLYLLLKDDDLYSDRKNLKVDQFIQLDAIMGEFNSTTEEGEVAALSTSGRLSLQRSTLPTMVSPVTSRKTDALKEAMKQLADTESKFSFLIDEYSRVEGLITLNDIMVQFAPPCMDSRINGGGFFTSALEQTGCNITEGTIGCDQN